MSLNLNNVLYSANGVDSASVLSVSNKILNQKAQNVQNAQTQQVNVQNIDYSKFNRATLGVDLYSNRTNVELQKQIAATQAGLFQKSVDVAKLNAQAAMNLYSAATVQRNVALAQSIEAKDSQTPTNREEVVQNTIQTLNINDKNSNSQNGFNPFAQAEEKQTTAESELSLLA